MNTINKRFGWGIKHSCPKDENPHCHFLWLEIFQTRKEAIQKAKQVFTGTWRQIKRKQHLSAVRVCLFELSKGEKGR